jgi:6-pyruvoyltetrahydropterin/6-carboxytetrahydropterin synthase
VDDRVPGPATAVRRVVRVERQRLKFAAAHMATFGDSLEPLHGHNYAAIVEVEGRLSDVGWVVDFGTLKKIGRDICEGLDHKFLLQRASAALGMQQDGATWQIWFGARRYAFPVEDVLALSIVNTTAELIAEWFWHEVAAKLRDAGVSTVERLTVGIEEAPGQAGWYGAALE